MHTAQHATHGGTLRIGFHRLQTNMMRADGATTDVTSRGKRKSADALVIDDVNKAGANQLHVRFITTQGR